MKCLWFGIYTRNIVWNQHLSQKTTEDSAVSSRWFGSKDDSNSEQALPHCLIGIGAYPSLGMALRK